MKIKVNDTVVIIAGKDKNKKGRVMKVFKKNNKIVVEKINILTKFKKKTAEKAGQKIKSEAPINASNAMVICPKCHKKTRVGYKKLTGGKKQRVCKKCKESMDLERKGKK